MIRLRPLLVLCAVFALTVGVAAATAGDGGNSANAKKCQKGGWQTLIRSDGTTFANQDACVSYAAQGGTLTTKSRSQLDCESFGGTFGADNQTIQPGTVLWTCNGNGVTLETNETLLPDCFADGGVTAAWQLEGTQGVSAFSCFL
jgi:hypothetical protein